MKKLLFILCLILLGGITVKAQEVVRNGNTFTEVSKKKQKEAFKPTPYTYVASDGTKYPIYISEKGKYFILPTSKKTGKQYRRYLPEVTKQLSK